jgi:Transcription termination factor nusG
LVYLKIWKGLLKYIFKKLYETFILKGKRGVCMTEWSEDLKYKTGWFACKVTSGHEMKVANELKKLIQHPKWSQYIFDVFVPTEKTVDKKGKEKLKVLIKENIYIKMVLTKDPSPVPEEQMQGLFRFRND